MAPTTDDSNFDPRRMSAREEHYERKRSPSPHSQKRVSAELVSVGDQFSLTAKQTSWERSKPIDIPEDGPSSHFSVTSDAKVEIMGTARQHTILIGSSRDGPNGIPPLKILPATSQEQFDILQAQRLMAKAENPSLHRSESSVGSTRESSPAPTMSEDYDVSVMKSVEPVSRAATVSTRPQTPPTPPPQSVASTEDGHQEAGKCPSSPSPWSTFDNRWGR